MLKKKQIFENCIYSVFILLIAVYLFSIFAVNLTGRVWSNFDIYSDAILAKYIWTSGSLFPKGWHFGNQIYTVATPAVAALFYGIVKDAYLALALASCFMTIGVLASFIWCLKPFCNTKSMIISLLVIIGGTIIGSTAHGDWWGLQVFYTMASYYACYVIGICLTLGGFFCLISQKRVPLVVLFLVLTYNFALGMQSVRELLVLNLPLCAVCILDIVLQHNSFAENIHKKRKGYLFALLALATNIGGVLTTKRLVSEGAVQQTTILSQVGGDFVTNFKLTMRALWNYIGLVEPTDYVTFLRLLSAIFSIIVILLAFITIFVDYREKKNLTVPGYCILFLTISLIAVFFAGLFFINVRSIYFFCWYMLVTVCVLLLMEKEWSTKHNVLRGLKNSLSIGILIISILNYFIGFYRSFSWVSSANDTYQEIVEQLQADDIKYLYSDWRVERNVISAVSHDEIQYGTLMFSGNTDDLWSPLNYLYYDDWFRPENCEHSYIVLSDYALYCLEDEFSLEYKEAFLDNLELVYEFPCSGETIYFYRGSEKIYEDMVR